MRISYFESLQLRGLAILMMIWLHCFNKDATGLTYISILPTVGGVTIPFLLTRFAQICVSLYCFLSGYGLYSKYPYPPHYVIKKAFVLTKQYWFVLFVFMVLGYFANYEREYSLCDIMGNYLGCKTTWNSTLWFMLPYVLLLLISKFIFEVINKLKGYAGFLLVFVIWIIAMAALKYEDTSTIEFNAFLKNVLQMLRLLFPFCLGVYAKKYEQIFERIRSNPSLSLLFIFISVLMLLTRLIIWNHFTLPFCCLCFVFLYHCLNVSDIVQRILAFFGEHSLYLWFCHAYFVYYFYRQYAFVARYPILIYSLVISYSLLSAFILSFSYKKTRI